MAIKMRRIKRYFLILIVIILAGLFFSGYFFIVYQESIILKDSPSYTLLRKGLKSFPILLKIAVGTLPDRGWKLSRSDFLENKKIILAQGKEEIKLPSIQTIGKLSVEEAISKRRSVREYNDEPLNLKEVSQILWAAGGITARWGGRTAPSAGALYPLEIYLVAGRVENLAPGIYHYNPERHSLIMIVEGNKRFALFSASLFQTCIKNAPVSLVICAQYDRTTRKYGKRGERYVHIEVGHVGQNIYLQAESLGLATVAIGAFMDEAVKKILNIKEEPLYIMPVGKK